MDNVKARRVLDLIDETFYTVRVAYVNGGKTYTYKVPLEVSLAVGDYVVVEGTSSLSVVWVTEVHQTANLDPEFEGTYKWIVCKIDTSRYNEIMEREKRFLQAYADRQREVLRLNARQSMMVDLEGGGTVLSSILEEITIRPAALASQGAESSKS